MLPVNNHPNKREQHTRTLMSYRYSAPRWVGWLVVALVACFVLVYLSLWMRGNRATPSLTSEETQESIKASQEKGVLRSYPGRTFSYSRQFNIPNATHLEAAQAVGIRPCANEEELRKQKARMRKIRTCHNYMVDELEHSLPYLTTNAAEELNRIGEGFADILERNGCPHYRFIVTSVTRTDASVRNLQRSGNINATSNSAHRYGTTFDITYRRFDKNDRSADYMTEDNLKLALGQVLLNEQRAGRIYVKYEYKQACFHITSRR